MKSASSGIDLHTFPSDDGTFRECVEDALARLDAPDPELLQRAIRERYPMAVVSVRSALASLPGDSALWYAFRRGVAQPPLDRWWERSDATAIVAEDRSFVEASEALAGIVELPVAELIGARVEDLVNPADQTAAEDIAALWLELVERGSAHGTVRFNRRDGTPREIEYHVESGAAAPGRYRAAIRER